MTAATDRQQEIILSCKIHRPNDVGHIYAARDETRLLVDHLVIDLASVVVILVPRLYQSAAQVCFEIGNSIFVNHDEVSLKQSDGQGAEPRHFH